MAAPIQYTATFTAQPDFTGRITEDTNIIDAPATLNQMIAEDRQYFLDNFQANFDALPGPIETYVQAYVAESEAALELSILNQVALQPPAVTTYDIKVTEAINAEIAANANTLETKTVADIIAQAGTTLLPTARVANADTLQDTTVQGILDQVPAIKVDLAANAERFNGLLYDDLKQEVITALYTQIDDDATTFNGMTSAQYKDFIKADAATTWTVFNSTNFDGQNGAAWRTEIIATKVNNAINADTVGGQSITQITNDRNAAIQAATDAYITNYANSLALYITSIKVDEALNADTFANMSQTQWELAIRQTVVDLAANSTKFAGLTQAEWEAKISATVAGDTNLINEVQLLVESQWKAYDAMHADTADFALNVSNAVLDTIADSVKSSFVSGDIIIDASSLNGEDRYDLIYASSTYALIDGTSSKTLKIIDATSEYNNAYTSEVFMQKFIFPRVLTAATDFAIPSIIGGAYRVTDPSINFPTSLFDPEALTIWSKKDRTYDSNGLLTSTDYYLTLDVNFDYRYENGLSPLTGYSATSVSGAYLDKVDEATSSFANLSGTAGKYEALIVSFRDGSTTETVSDISGAWAASSPNMVFSDSLGTNAFNVAPKYNVTLSKTFTINYQDEVTGLQAGDTVDYVYIITNRTSSTLSTVTLSDVNAGIVLSVSSWASIAAGQIITVTGTYTVTATDQTNGFLPTSEGSLDATYDLTTTAFTKYERPKGSVPVISGLTFTVSKYSTVYGSTTNPSESVTVTMRDAEQVIVTSDADGQFSASSTNEQPAATYTPSVQERLILTVDNTYVNNLLDTKVINYCPDWKTGDITAVPIFSIDNTYTYSVTPVAGMQEIITEEVPSGNFPTSVATRYEIINDVPYEVQTSITEVMPELWTGLDIKFYTEYIINGTGVGGLPQAGDTITYTYTLINNTGGTITGLSITESNASIVLTGGATLADLTDGSTGTKTGTYTILADDITNGTMPAQSALISGTDAGAASFSRYQRNSRTVQYTVDYYPLTTTASAELGTTL